MKNNLEAVKEVVHQLRLRDIGGIIVIDFIDMANPEESRDRRGRTSQRARTRPDEDLRGRDLAARAGRDDAPERHRRSSRDPHDRSAPCAQATGSSSRKRRTLWRSSGGSGRSRRARACRRSRSPSIPESSRCSRVPADERLQAVEAAARRRFFLVPAAPENGHVHLDHFEVLRKASSRRSSPRLPSRKGPLELKLVEVGLYDPAAGVGKVDGSEIVVAGAAKLVGKKVSVDVGRVLDGVAFATLADSRRCADADHVRGRGGEADACAEPGERFAEGPATRSRPRPKQRRRSPKPSRPSRARELTRTRRPRPPTVAPSERRRRGAAKKKRTRRGTRGGRGRKKPAAAGRRDGQPTRRDARRAPDEGPRRRIHVPSVELAVEPTSSGPRRSRSPDADAGAEATPQRTGSRSASARGGVRVEAASARSPRRTATAAEARAGDDGA